jgi:hypothetical protein
LKDYKSNIHFARSEVKAQKALATAPQSHSQATFVAPPADHKPPSAVENHNWKASRARLGDRPPEQLISTTAAEFVAKQLTAHEQPTVNTAALQASHWHVGEPNAPASAGTGNGVGVATAVAPGAQPASAAAVAAAAGASDGSVAAHVAAVTGEVVRIGGAKRVRPRATGTGLDGAGLGASHAYASSAAPNTAPAAPHGLGQGHLRTSSAGAAGAAGTGVAVGAGRGGDMYRSTAAIALQRTIEARAKLAETGRLEEAGAGVTNKQETHRKKTEFWTKTNFPM